VDEIHAGERQADMKINSWDQETVHRLTSHGMYSCNECIGSVQENSKYTNEREIKRNKRKTTILMC
jgi:hypothetical protein